MSDKNQSQTQELSVAYQGPPPTSREFAGYEQALPGAADRILAITEKEAEYRRVNQEKAQRQGADFRAYHRHSSNHRRWFKHLLFSAYGFNSPDSYRYNRVIVHLAGKSPYALFSISSMARRFLYMIL
jgi:hypothetical protein